jgi:hypothetical protein
MRTPGRRHVFLAAIALTLIATGSAAYAATTIASLDALSKPANLPANNRVLPAEATVFTLSATLTQYKLEADSDYHLMLTDGSGHHDRRAGRPGVGRLGQCPAEQHPEGPLGVRREIRRDRKLSDRECPGHRDGVGFFDFLHGQTGVARNGIELHSVLDVQFGAGAGANTVTSPAAQTATVGVAASLQVRATDSAASSAGTTAYDTLSVQVGSFVLDDTALTLS